MKGFIYMLYNLHWKQSLAVLKHFVHRELIVIGNNFRRIFINGLIWPVCTGFVFGYVMPLLGLGRDYAGFMILGVIIASCFYICFEAASALTQDFEEGHRFVYEMGLPFDTPFLFAKYVITFGLRALLEVAALPFLSKLILIDRFSFAQFSLIKYCIILVLLNIAFGAFSVWLSGMMKMASIMDFRLRVIDQMFFLGCFMFSWHTLFKALPFAAYLNLLNPVVYSMEAMRVAFFGQAGYLPFWPCCGVLSFQALLFFGLAVRTLYKRLDCVKV